MPFLSLTNERPRRVICFYGHATVKLSLLGWFALVSFGFHLALLAALT